MRILIIAADITDQAFASEKLRRAGFKIKTVDANHVRPEDISLSDAACFRDIQSGNLIICSLRSGNDLIAISQQNKNSILSQIFDLTREDKMVIQPDWNQSELVENVTSFLDGQQIEPPSEKTIIEPLKPLLEPRPIDALNIIEIRKKIVRANKQGAYNGELPLTVDGRWTVAKKISLLSHLKAGRLSVEDVEIFYGFTKAELDSWKSKLDKHGKDGLKVIRLQDLDR